MTKNKKVIYFHVATIGKYQEIFDEIYSEILNSGLINEIISLNICIVGEGNLIINPNLKVKVYRNSFIDSGEFFTLELLKTFAESTEENYKILYVHTKGVTTPNNQCIVDWRKYMTYFNVNQYEKCFNALDTYDSCGVDLVTEPAVHYCGNFWWANSSYVKKLPSINEMKFPKNPLTFSNPGISVRHNCEFWIGMGNGNLKSLWNSNINVYERHLHTYSKNNYI